MIQREQTGSDVKVFGATELTLTTNTFNAARPTAVVRRSRRLLAKVTATTMRSCSEGVQESRQGHGGYGECLRAEGTPQPTPKKTGATSNYHQQELE